MLCEYSTKYQFTILLPQMHVKAVQYTTQCRNIIICYGIVMLITR
jgi:hypothetical protein